MHFGPFVQELLQTPQKMIRARGPEDLARSPAKFGQHDVHGARGLARARVLASCKLWDVRRLERDSRSEHSYPNEVIDANSILRFCSAASHCVHAHAFEWCVAGILCVR
jgi:hypothetical protein